MYDISFPGAAQRRPPAPLDRFQQLLIQLEAFEEALDLKEEKGWSKPWHQEKFAALGDYFPRALTLSAKAALNSHGEREAAEKMGLLSLVTLFAGCPPSPRPANRPPQKATGAPIPWRMRL